MGYKELQAPLKIKDIDFRVQSINKGGYATILAYKDARVDMKQLDEAVGIENWQRDVKLVNGVLYGGVGIFNKEIQQWIWKWDAGTESNTEKEKGQASDAFKRACFNLGIGRELYNYPVISVKLHETEITKKGDKMYASWGFKLKEWKWLSQFKNGELSFLAAKDTNGAMRFKWGTYNKELEEVESTASGAPNPAPIEDVSPIAKDANVGQFLQKKAVKEEADAPIEVVTEEDIKRAELAQKYKLMFGKAPSKAMKLTTLEGKIAEETEKRATAKAEAEKAELALSEELNKSQQEGGAVYSAPGEVAEVVAEEEVIEEVDPYEEKKSTISDEQIEDVVDLGVYEGPMVDDANAIAKFTDKNEFKEWAVKSFKKWAGKAPDSHIAEFKELCNTHFEKIA